MMVPCFAASFQFVTLPESLQVIGSGAFNYCTNLQTVTIPEQVTAVYDHAFSDCELLSSVVFAGDETATDNVCKSAAMHFSAVSS